MVERFPSMPEAFSIPGAGMGWEEHVSKFAPTPPFSDESHGTLIYEVLHVTSSNLKEGTEAFLLNAVISPPKR